MTFIVKFATFCCLLLLFFSASFGDGPCSFQTEKTQHVFPSCSELSSFGSTLYWNYTETTKTLSVAYKHPNVKSSKWVAWGINPTSTGMAGTQAFIAYKKPNGVVHAYTSPISGYATALSEGALSFPVNNVSAVLEKNEMIIFTSFVVPGTEMNYIWQEGPADGDKLRMHPTKIDNLKSMDDFNLVPGQPKKKNKGKEEFEDKVQLALVHAGLNLVSWGILMPVGIITARYLKAFKSAGAAWFHLHRACQTIAYILGASGWAIGLYIGGTAIGIRNLQHRYIGITLFCLGTLQVLALLLRPKPDHKSRRVWNIYHHFTGNTVFILSSVNIFIGFEFLDPDWKAGYIGTLIVLWVTIIVLEVYTSRMKSTEQMSETESAEADGSRRLM